MKKQSIIIVDDHEMIREGLVALIQQLTYIELQGVFQSGNTLLEKLKFPPYPDIIILDINLPDLDGLILTQKIKQIYPEIKVLIFSMYMRPEFIRKLKEYKADGYVSKSAGHEHLIAAINVLSNDGTYLSDNILKQQGFKVSDSTYDLLSSLSNREKEIVRLIANGKSSKEIAKSLFLSKFTIDNHRKKILSKIGGKNSVDITNFGEKSGIVKSFDKQ